MSWRFVVFILVSFAAFVAILDVTLRGRSERPPVSSVLKVATVVVVAGMLFAKIGASVGLPVWLYFGLPALVTWLLPPIAFRMRRREVMTYLPLALLMAPAIHAAFSFFLGWNEYMPFLSVPSADS